MQILNEATELVAIDSIRPHERNVNQADLGAIIGSLEANGFGAASWCKRARAKS